MYLLSRYDMSVQSATKSVYEVSFTLIFLQRGQTAPPPIAVKERYFCSIISAIRSSRALCRSQSGITRSSSNQKAGP